jgi:hypothetical protein
VPEKPLTKLLEDIIRLRDRIKTGITIDPLDTALNGMQRDVEQLVEKDRRSEPQKDYEFIVLGRQIPIEVIRLPVWQGELAMRSNPPNRQTSPGSVGILAAVAERLTAKYHDDRELGFALHFQDLIVREKI